MTSWSTPTGSRPTSTTPRSSSSRSTRTPRPTTRTTSERRPHRLEEGPPGPGPPRLRRQGAASRRCCPPRASATTTPSCSTAATTTGSPPTPTGTSSSTATSDVKLLDGGRKKWELDSRELVADVPERPGHDVHRQGAGHLDPRVPRRRGRPRSAAQNLVDVRSPDEFSGKLLAPAHLPQEQSQRRRPRPDRPQHPVVARRQRRRHLQVRRRADARSTPRRASTSAQDTIAYCRIGERSAHTWFVLHELLGVANVKNYDGSWTEYGSLVGVPIELGAN